MKPKMTQSEFLLRLAFICAIGLTFTVTQFVYDLKLKGEHL